MEGCSISHHDYLQDRKVCVTGRLVSMTHAEFARLVQSCGGTFVRRPTRSSVILVVGDDGWPAERDGSPSHVLVRARRLRALGYPIELVSEDDFLERLGLSQPADAIRGHHTVADLARILHISPVRLRRWVRAGLIVPVAAKHRLDYFDFRQVSFARRLAELIDSGVSLRAVRQGIEQCKGWLPNARDHLLQLEKWESGDAVLVRFNGALYDPSGQRYFDFENLDGNSQSVVHPDLDQQPQAAILFDRALQLEDQDQLTEAADHYRQAIQLDPHDPILQFNLGNVLYRLGEAEASASCYGEALARDPNYAEAWNNLGNAYTEMERWEDAEDALRRALELIPGYADAHFNLAEVLERLGQTQHAEVHRRTYQELSAHNNLDLTADFALRIYAGDHESEQQSS
jgi:tetratricopeptide (TPR) repeat protein